MARVAGRLFFTVGLVVCAGGSAPQAGEPFTRIQALFADDFRGGLSRWASESEAPGKVEAVGGILSIDVPAGSTLWFRPELKGSVSIQCEARMVQAVDPTRSPGDLFATRRSGQFSEYNQLRAYYVGQGGNSNTTTRFRRYIGDNRKYCGPAAVAGARPARTAMCYCNRMSGRQ
ncbi:MAG TPA: DUF6250 domain-containing protein [Bryobacteraceae bacterium]|nr:DUF6250 domain-containing protein [Bryobacteraceae bacterium]